MAALKKAIVIFLLVIISFLLQCTILKSLSLGGVAPNLLIIITSSVGFMSGKNTGMLTGFFSGLLIDIFFGGGILGIYAFIYMLIGCANGVFTRLFFPEDVKFPIIVITVSELACCFISYTVFFLLRGRLSFPSYFRHVILPEIVYTIFATVVFFRLILYIHNRLSESEA